MITLRHVCPLAASVSRKRYHARRSVVVIETKAVSISIDGSAKTVLSASDKPEELLRIRHSVRAIVGCQMNE